MARGTCWEGYEQKGFKKKGNKSVPNCVKKASNGEFMDESKAHESKESKKEKNGGFIDMTKDKKYWKGII